jgi:hypothetical protein
MKVTRNGVFETNSSSTHSLAIDYNSSLMPQPFSDEITDQGYVEVHAGEFGWEVETFTSVWDKLSYVFTSAASGLGEDVDANTVVGNVKLDLIREAVRKHTGLEVVFTTSDSSFWGHGYIDHQSSDVPDEAFESVDSMSQFLFAPRSYFETDNDNR